MTVNTVRNGTPAAFPTARECGRCREKDDKLNFRRNECDDFQSRRSGVSLGCCWSLSGSPLPRSGPLVSNVRGDLLISHETVAAVFACSRVTINRAASGEVEVAADLPAGNARRQYFSVDDLYNLRRDWLIETCAAYGLVAYDDATS